MTTRQLTRHLTESLRRYSTKPQTNGDIKPIVTNRNPRNLERLRLLRKPSGYGLEKTNVCYWHCLKIFRTKACVCAQIVHNSGKVVVEVSTSEFGIRKQLALCNLDSRKDNIAYTIAANVFAERCVESGITSFHYPNLDQVKEGTNVYTFLEILKKEGLSISEPEYYNIYDIWRKKIEKKPWTVLED